jgi:hypothetical protein
MATVPLPLWQADYDRRKALGQVGWTNGKQTWDLTPYNSLSAFGDTVRPIFKCPTCNGSGHVSQENI